uniref:Uncharacterized protein n=1 Tax=Magallana gigas TaxID=29159 RepID=A0A8W8LTL2_MAGGI
MPRETEDTVQGDSPLKPMYIRDFRIRNRPTGPTISELSAIFYDTKHPFYPRPRATRRKHSPDQFLTTVVIKTMKNLQSLGLFLLAAILVVNAQNNTAPKTAQGAGKGERKKETQAFDGLLCYYQSQHLGRLLAVPKRPGGAKAYIP